MAKRVWQTATIVFALLLCVSFAVWGIGSVTTHATEKATPQENATVSVVADGTTTPTTENVTDAEDTNPVFAPSEQPTDATDTESGTPDEPAQPETPAQGWDGNLVAAGWSGETTAPDTYKVENKEVTIGDEAAFAYFANQVYRGALEHFAGYTVTLQSDINLNNKLWIPIGFDIRKTVDGKETLDHSFRGIFDGNNHTVKNFTAAPFLAAIAEETISGSADLYVTIAPDKKVPLPHNGDPKFHYGLFGVTGNATIKNLTIADFAFDFTFNTVTWGDKKLIADSVAALVGYAGGSITVENCVVGNETSVIKGAACAGGIVGRAYPGYYKGAIRDESQPNNIGTEQIEVFGSGLKTPNSLKSGNGTVQPDLATRQPIKMTRCKNYVTCGAEDEKEKKGGILGYSYFMSAVEFIDCENYGDMYGEYTGGVTTYTQDSQIEILYQNCANYGNMYQTSDQTFPASGDISKYAGGIAGRIFSSDAASLVIENCVNYGAVVGNWVDAAGGIVGKLHVNVKQDSTAKNRVSACFNYGNVSVKNQYINGTTQTPAKYAKAGGVFGELIVSGANGNIVLSCGNCAFVEGKGYVGGVIGSESTNSYKVEYMINAYGSVEKVGNK